MNKDDFITEVAAAADMSKTAARSAVDAFIGAVEKALKAGDELRLVGFGTFSSIRRKASEGRNPRTGEKIQIQAANVPKFKPGKQLRDSLN